MSRQERNSPTRVQSRLLDQTAEDDRLATVGRDHTLGRRPENIVDQDRLPANAGRDQRPTVVVAGRSSGVDRP